MKVEIVGYIDNSKVQQFKDEMKDSPETIAQQMEMSIEPTKIAPHKMTMTFELTEATDVEPSTEGN